MSQSENLDGADITRQDERPLSRKQFCELENISLSTYHKLKRQGLGPDETCFKGMGLARISAKARRSWHSKIEKWNSTKEAELEKARRVAISKKAAESPKHVSKRNKAAKGAATKKPVRLSRRPQRG
jgi:hypothetical protein